MRNIVAVYNKTEIIEGVYIFTFNEILENVKYDENEDAIRYFKDGTKKIMYNMEDLEFLVSDEKLCFSDYIEYDEFNKEYDGTFDEKKELFVQSCKNFVRYIVLDESKEAVKLINSNIDSIMQAQPDTHFFDYKIVGTDTSKLFATFPSETLQAILKNLENDNASYVIEQINSIFTVMDSIEKNENMEEDSKEENEEKTEIDIEETFNNLVGLNNIKEEITKLYNYCDFCNKIKEITDMQSLNLNMVFSGNPGTGKTTVARIIAKILNKFGYVNNNFMEITAKSLVAEYVGQTATKTEKLLEYAKGGVIFVDEAYGLCSEYDSFSKDAIVEVIKEMELKKTVFIFAGYKKEMEYFVDMNPGIKSRVGYFMDFENYTLDELTKMFELKMRKYKFMWDDDVKSKIVQIIDKFRNNDKFGNGRFIDNLFEKIIINHASNVKDSDDLATLLTITGRDVDQKVTSSLSDKTKIKVGY